MDKYCDFVSVKMIVVVQRKIYIQKKQIVLLVLERK